MSKTITIKLTKGGINIDPFDIKDQFGNVIASGVSRETLINGISYIVDDNVSILTLASTGECRSTVSKNVTTITKAEYAAVEVDTDTTACLWSHLVDHTLYNSFYGNIHPYIIEYPLAFNYKDEILQSVESYDKVYRYFTSPLDVSDRNLRVSLDNEWFNKAVVYNDQQSSGILNLVVKPVNNMKDYLLYPKYNDDSKSILWTKVDNIYNYNTFWSAILHKGEPLFLTTCKSLSIDKEVNQGNMDYSVRAYKKDTIRSKDLKIRHILDDKSDITIVTQFMIAQTQNSYL